MVVEFDFMPKHETDVDLESVWVNLWKRNIKSFLQYSDY
jgi:hypothetical protein